MTVQFTNILQAAFYYQSSLRTFCVLTIWVCNFLAKGFGAKAAHKMLVKLTHLLTLFEKLDLLISMQQILLMVTKWSSLQKNVSKFMPKWFY
jgi:hypothetical protein